MKTIIAGSRGLGLSSLYDGLEFCSFIQDITTIVSGTAKGIDQAGEAYAGVNKLNIVRFPADWSRYGRAAGHIRNAEMADFADALIAIWDGYSSGTRNMIKTAKARGLKVFVYNTSDFSYWEHK